MATQSTVVRTHTPRSMSMVLGLATILTTVIIGGWLLRPTTPATVPTPIAPAGVPVGSPARPAANRFFADEIAGASAQDLTSAASGMQPEWAQEQPQHAALAVVAPQPSSAGANRSFADEIAGAPMAYRDPALITGPLPERLQDLPQPAILSPVARPERMRVTNRFFADEIAARIGSADWAALEVPATLRLHGPR